MFPAKEGNLPGLSNFFFEILPDRLIVNVIKEKRHDHKGDQNILAM